MLHKLIKNRAKGVDLIHQGFWVHFELPQIPTCFKREQKKKKKEKTVINMQILSSGLLSLWLNASGESLRSKI